MAQVPTYEIETFRGKQGYWVRDHQFYKISNFQRLFVLNSIKKGIPLRKTFNMKNESGAIFLFVMIDEPIYQTKELKIYIMRKKIFENIVINEEEHNGRKGHWLNLGQYAELLNISEIDLIKKYESMDEEDYPEETIVNKKSPTEWLFFVTIDDEPYASEQAIIFRNLFLINTLESEKMSLLDVFKWSEIKTLSVLLEENSKTSDLLMRLSKETEESVDSILRLTKKFKGLFEPSA
jgi:hypothetical protein